MPRKDAYGGTISAQAQQDLVSEGIENFELPKSLVMKIAKSAVPENVKLQKETVLSLVKGSTVFINYLAATAHDVAQSRQHKSISASDVIKALEMLQFRTVAITCQHELNVYREVAKQVEARSKKTGNASTSAASKKTGTPNPTGNISSASASAKGKGKERAVPAIPLPPPFTSAPLPLGIGSTDDGQGSGPLAESISASEIVERRDEPMDVDTWAGPVDDGVPQNIESGSFNPDDRSGFVETAPVT